MSFPKDFIWGAGTSAYQIEGAAFTDGKGLSIWDVFSHEKDRVWSNHNGDTAAMHYSNYKEDVKLMKECGLKSYSFSMCWPRIIPDGIGKVNQHGLTFYNNLIDELLKADILPLVTMYHWDLPFELHCKGGWLNSDSVNWFAEYTKVLMENFSDRVQNWITHCEPQCFINEGYLAGLAAPGYKTGIKEALKVCHNVLLSHGKAVQTIRSYSKTESNVGLSSIGVINIPHSNGDISLAEKEMFSVKDFDMWNNTWCLDPIFFGKYPEDGLKLFEKYLPDYTDKEMEIISEPIDFLGITVYEGSIVNADSKGKVQEVEAKPGDPFTTMQFPIVPESLYWGPKFYYERYKKPIYITENGIAFYDTPSLDNKIYDHQRIDFVNRNLKCLQDAIEEGVDIKGYIYWSFMDNLEWQDGYKERFGLVHVDFNNMTRTVKESAYWYKEVIESNGDII